MPSITSNKYLVNSLVESATSIFLLNNKPLYHDFHDITVEIREMGTASYYRELPNSLSRAGAHEARAGH